MRSPTKSISKCFSRRTDYRILNNPVYDTGSKQRDIYASNLKTVFAALTDEYLSVTEIARRCSVPMSVARVGWLCAFLTRDGMIDGGFCPGGKLKPLYKLKPKLVQ